MFERNGDEEKERNRGQKGAKRKEKERDREGRSGVFGQGWNFRAGTSLKIHAARNAGRELELLRIHGPLFSSSARQSEARRFQTRRTSDGMYVPLEFS